MAVGDVRIKEDNTKEVLETMEEKVIAALTAIGEYAEEQASKRCPVDTGLLKNSITYALAGGGATRDSYVADNPDKSGNTRSGSYSGTIGSSKEKAVYIGTNVNYAPYVEMGTSHHPEPKPFLKPAVEENRQKYQEIAEKIIKSD